MIRVTIDLIPGGVGHAKCLGQVEIANTGQGTASRGQYRYRVFGKAMPGRFSKAGKVLAEGSIQNFPRKKLLAHDLLLLALFDARKDSLEPKAIDEMTVALINHPKAPNEYRGI